MTFSIERLAAFVSWAGQQQACGLAEASSWVTTLTVGRATNNRAVSFKAELFRIESTGWIGEELTKFGSLTLGENGCADSTFWDGGGDQQNTDDCLDHEHWDDVEPDQFDVLFAPFLAKLKAA